MRSVRVRVLTAAVLAVIASAGLSACRTKVGVAATADGLRITETQVSDYITSHAKPVQSQAASGATISVAPRTFVVREIITTRLFVKILTLMKAVPDEHTVQLRLGQLIGKETPQHFVSTRGVSGYTPAFAKLVLRAGILVDEIRTIANNGFDLRPIFAKLKFPVSVNPRYGAWDPKNLQMSDDPYAGLPSVLLRPTAAATATR